MSVPPRRFLVTAGSTREAIDSVRDWGNVFTGNTGLAIAQALCSIGTVDLLTSNRQHLAELANPSPGRPHATPFATHAQLKAALAHHMAASTYDAVFMTAAVADYEPRGVFKVLNRSETDSHGNQVWTVTSVQAKKVKSSHDQIAVLGTPTEKLVDLLRRDWKFAGLLVKFKLEVGLSRSDLIAIGQQSRLASGADYLVANTLDMVAGPEAGAILLGNDLTEWVPRDALPHRLVRLVAEHVS